VESIINNKGGKMNKRERENAYLDKLDNLADKIISLENELKRLFSQMEGGCDGKCESCTKEAGKQKSVQKPSKK
jgi:hypothetical protein